jgi:hypothetical protein
MWDLRFSGLKMETVCFSETLVSTYKSIQRHNPQQQHRHFRRPKNLKSHIFNTLILTYWVVTFFCIREVWVPTEAFLKKDVCNFQVLHEGNNLKSATTPLLHIVLDSYTQTPRKRVPLQKLIVKLLVIFPWRFIIVRIVPPANMILIRGIVMGHLVHKAMVGLDFSGPFYFHCNPFISKI